MPATATARPTPGSSGGFYLITTAEGMPIVWSLANFKIGEREATRALLEHDHHLIASGQLIVADKGSLAATSNSSSPPTSART